MRKLAGTMVGLRAPTSTCARVTTALGRARPSRITVSEYHRPHRERGSGTSRSRGAGPAVRPAPGGPDFTTAGTGRGPAAITPGVLGHRVVEPLPEGLYQPAMARRMSRVRRSSCRVGVRAAPTAAQADPGRGSVWESAAYACSHQMILPVVV